MTNQMFLSNQTQLFFFALSLPFTQPPPIWPPCFMCGQLVVRRLVAQGSHWPYELAQAAEAVAARLLCAQAKHAPPLEALRLAVPYLSDPQAQLAAARILRFLVCVCVCVCL